MISKYREAHFAIHGRIQYSKDEKCCFATTRAPFHESGAHTVARAPFSTPPNPYLERAGSSGAPGGGGAGNWGTDTPLPLLCRLRRSQRLGINEPISPHDGKHAGPAGAADFHCLRQPPPPPQKLCKSRVERSDGAKNKIKGRKPKLVEFTIPKTKSCVSLPGEQEKTKMTCRRPPLGGCYTRARC